MRTDWWEFGHKPQFSVWWRGELLHGHLRKKLLAATCVERILDYIVDNLAGKACEEFYAAEAEDGGYRGTRAGKLRECKATVRDGLEKGDWWMPKLFQKVLQGSGGMYAVSMRCMTRC